MSEAVTFANIQKSFATAGAIPVLNKIDMPNAMIDEVTDQIIDLVGIPKSDILLASGKTGEGMDKILEAIVEFIPHNGFYI